MYGSRDHSVGIATGYELDDRGVAVKVPVGVRIFTSSRRPDRLWGTCLLAESPLGRGVVVGHGSSGERGNDLTQTEAR
jgi:hypothetical protein